MFNILNILLFVCGTEIAVLPSGSQTLSLGAPPLGFLEDH